jgi:hypothetical protein
VQELHAIFSWIGIGTACLLLRLHAFFSAISALELHAILAIPALELHAFFVCCFGIGTACN